MTVQLAADLGYGIPWLANTLVILITIATAFFIYIVLSVLLFIKLIIVPSFKEFAMFFGMFWQLLLLIY